MEFINSILNQLGEQQSQVPTTASNPTGEAVHRVPVLVYFNPNDGHNPIPQEFINQIKIVETITSPCPTFELHFSDLDGQLFDRQGTAEVHIVFGTYNDNKLVSMWGHVLSEPESSTFYTYDLGTHPQTVRGNLAIGMDLFGSGKRRLFRGSASRVFEQLVRKDISLLPYDEINVENSVDTPKGWIQPGWTNGQFIKYLTDKAVSPSRPRHGSGYLAGFLSWFDMEPFNGQIVPNATFITPVRANFVSTTYLIQQPVKHNVLITQNPQDLLMGYRNDGKNANNEYIGLAFSNMYSSTFNIPVYKRQVSYFDTTKRKYGEDSYTFTQDFFGQKLTQVGDETKYDVVLKHIDRVNRVKSLSTESEDSAKNLKYVDIHRHIFKRTMGLLTIGTPNIRLGDKVRTLVPVLTQSKGVNKSVSTDWIVLRKMHIIDFPAQMYATKYELGTDEYNGEF